MNRELKKIVLKDLKYNLKDLGLVILCESILIAIAYAGMVGYQMFIGGNTNEEYLQYDSISAMFMSAGKIFFFSGIVLIITIFVLYLSKRVPTYIMLKRMGMSGKDFKSMVAMEIMVSYFVSIIAGIFLGIIMSLVVKLYVTRSLDIEILGHVSIFTIPIICSVMLLFYILGFKLVKELETDFLLVSNAGETTRTEKMTGKLDWIKIIVGLILVVYSVYAFERPFNAESTWLIVAFFVGLYLLLKSILMKYLDSVRRRNPDKYYKNLLSRNRWYFRPNTVSRFILFCTVISFLACFYFGFQAVSLLHAEKPEELYPYDFMVLANRDDDSLITGLKEKYGAEVSEYPMVRVSNMDKTEKLEVRGATPIQGQQIGISETTYNSLKKAIDPDYQPVSLGLDKEGNKVYIVHQQDDSIKAQPVDWYYFKSKPNLHIGVPNVYVDSGSKMNTFIEREVVGEEFGTLTGVYGTTKIENIIVFSDDYFKTAQAFWKTIDSQTGFMLDYYKSLEMGEPTFIEGPIDLVLVKAKSNNIAEIDKVLGTQEANHDYLDNYDSTVKFHYSTSISINNLKSERAIRLMISIYSMIVMMFMNWIMVYALNELEIKEKKERYTLLNNIGMGEKKVDRLCRKELFRFFTIPTIMFVASACVFFCDTIRARMFDSLLSKACALDMTIIIGAYIVVTAIFFIILDLFNRKEFKK